MILIGQVQYFDLTQAFSQPLRQSCQIGGIHSPQNLVSMAAVDSQEVVCVKVNIVALTKPMEPGFD